VLVRLTKYFGAAGLAAGLKRATAAPHPPPTQPPSGPLPHLNRTCPPGRSVAATWRSARDMASGEMADSTKIIMHTSTLAGGTLAVRSSPARAATCQRSTAQHQRMASDAQMQLKSHKRRHALRGPVHQSLATALRLHSALRLLPCTNAALPCLATHTALHRCRHCPATHP
jgi:hypothetical protein